MKNQIEIKNPELQKATPVESSGPSEKDIANKAQELMGNEGVIDDLQRFANGSGNPESTPVDMFDADEESAQNEEDRRTRAEVYPGWTERDFQSLLDTIAQAKSQMKSQEALIQEEQVSKQESVIQVREARNDAQIEVLLVGTSGDVRSEMYGDLIDLYDEAFDSDAFMEKFGLDEATFGTWNTSDWKKLLKRLEDE
ncbi:MAG: hypothetical protein ABII18_06685 [bacterium]